MRKNSATVPNTVRFKRTGDTLHIDVTTKASVYQSLEMELCRLRDGVAAAAAISTKFHAGSGSWWELNGYADVLRDAIKRIHDHRKRVVRVDQQIARET